MTPHTLRIAWPILDPDTVSLAEVRRQALAELRATVRTHGWRTTSHVGIEVTHGAAPEVVATVQVLAPAGADEIVAVAA